ncbi:hypothetical protein B4O97_03970 [Marispirochaeta aestuarii]|uniref:Uncharacterized protein n=1 Tax=Marispirochaeta aestuarii TaxID=1963862 RepID=A0A1Y1S1H5_9SPIO|nr:hypothetical protein [Marispirochaeta aestuarii]ORC37358.1 hypothetical protein B4O97_03970 [Marispirochaeta aestuarii]
MSMRHPKLQQWDETMKKMFDEIDDYLEEKYGHLYPLHPNRAKRGKTSNKEHDGLFNVGTSFTAGFGSELGKGYIIDIDMVTLTRIPDDVREEIEEEVVDLVQERLPRFFPDRDLTVSRDGHVYKIHGDFSLGSL